MLPPEPMPELRERLARGAVGFISKRLPLDEVVQVLVLFLALLFGVIKYNGCYHISAFHEYLMILPIFLKTAGFRKTRFFDRSRSSRAHWRVARQKTISKMVSRARDVGEAP